MKFLREVVEPQLVELRDALLERHDVVAAERLEGRLRRVDADAGRAVQVEPLRRVEGLLWAGALLQRRQRLYLHCAAGIRVHPAKACLEQLGCDDVVALQEGISELYELGFDDLAE